MAPPKIEKYGKKIILKKDGSKLVSIQEQTSVNLSFYYIIILIVDKYCCSCCCSCWYCSCFSYFPIILIQFFPIQVFELILFIFFPTNFVQLSPFIQVFQLILPPKNQINFIHLVQLIW